MKKYDKKHKYGKEASVTLEHPSTSQPEFAVRNTRDERRGGNGGAMGILKMLEIKKTGNVKLES